MWMRCVMRELRILVYTVNRPQRAAELLRWGVDCICTDAIDTIGPDFQPFKAQSFLTER